VSLSNLVRARCASFALGHCLGLDAYSRPFRPEGPCAVLAGERCDYFSRVVLRDSLARGQGAAAAKAYAAIDPKGGAPAARAARRCACGQEIPKGHRTCGDCARRRRKETYRRSQQNRRQVLRQGVNS
jgi:hypothetical protein